MNYEEAVEKVQALLRKAQCSSTTPEESALFAAKAQELMDKYRIENLMSSDEARDPDEPIENLANEATLQVCREDKRWALYLSRIVAEANGCKSYFADHFSGCKTYLVGRASDAQTARYMTGMLSAEVRRLAREHARAYSAAYRRDFKYGVVDAIQIKLREQWQKTKSDARTGANPLALVRVDKALATMEKRSADVTQWMAQHTKMRTVHSRAAAPDVSARVAGMVAGQSIQINRARGGLTSGARSLGSGQS